MVSVCRSSVVKSAGAEAAGEVLFQSRDSSCISTSSGEKWEGLWNGESPGNSVAASGDCAGAAVSMSNCAACSGRVTSGGATGARGAGVVRSDRKASSGRKLAGAATGTAAGAESPKRWQRLDSCTSGDL